MTGVITMALQVKTINRLLGFCFMGLFSIAAMTSAWANPIFMIQQGFPFARIPQWFSAPQTTTYTDAVSICASYGGRLCYRAEYCPNGYAGGENPYGGKKSGDQWAAVKDQVNNWVEVGNGGWPSCQLHTEINGGSYGLPSWSTNSTAQSFRNWVLCCFQ